ncbi:MAG: DUF3108 domain-containing protein [Pseudomonadota bacterium]
MAHRKPLALIAVGVIAAHVVLLQSVGLQLQPPDPLSVKALITRTLVTPEAAPAVAEAPPAPAAPAPLRPARTPRSVRSAAPDIAAQPASAASAPVAAASVVQPVETPAPPPVPVAEAPSPSPPPAPPPAPSQAPTPAVALAIPGSIKLNYKVFAVYRGQDRQLSGSLQWRHDGVNYDARLEMSVPLLGARSDQSVGRITPEGLAPQRYASKARNEEATHFDRDRGRIVFSANKPEAALMAGAQDRLSVLLQLSALVGGSPAKFRAGNSVTIQTAGPRDAEPWIFTVEGDEQLQLPGGAMTALKLMRMPRKEFDQKVELWLAPGMDYVPVRVRLTNANGDSFDQQWSGTDKG